MGCINSGSIFAMKQSTIFYSGELECRTILGQRLHQTFIHGSKKLHGHCNGHTLINGINLPVKLCEGNQKGFLTHMLKGNTYHNPPVPSSHQPVASLCIGAAPQGSMALLVNRGTSVTSWLPQCKRNQQPIPLLCLECHHEPQLQQVTRVTQNMLTE